MNKRFRKILLFILIPSVFLITVILFAVTQNLPLFDFSRQYATTSVEDYGKYTGNYDNRTVQAFINSFFPDRLENTFSNINYSYRAQKYDTYAFEAYLSFNIEDDDLYQAAVATYTSGLPQSEFRYDSTYTQYSLVDKFSPGSLTGTNTTDVYIQYAKIGKILCNPEQNEIIFVALGVYDGGVATTSYLTTYFDRFQIDPLEYAKHTVPQTYEK